MFLAYWESTLVCRGFLYIHHCIRGGLELVASRLLLRFFWHWGALLTFEIMSCAIVFHLFTPLGVAMSQFDDMEVIIGNDCGILFGQACLTWIAALALLVKNLTSSESQIRGILPNRYK